MVPIDTQGLQGCERWGKPTCRTRKLPFGDDIPPGWTTIGESCTAATNHIIAIRVTAETHKRSLAITAEVALGRTSILETSLNLLENCIRVKGLLDTTRQGKLQIVSLVLQQRRIIQ